MYHFHCRTERRRQLGVVEWSGGGGGGRVKTDTILYADRQILSGCGARSVSFWAHRKLFWQLPKTETETRMVRACHKRQPLQNHPPRALQSMGDAVAARSNARWTMSVKEWTFLPMSELLTRVSCRKDWNRIPAESSVISTRRPNRSRD